MRISLPLPQQVSKVFAASWFNSTPTLPSGAVLRRALPKLAFLLAFFVAAPSAPAATQYPLTIENCGRTLTFERPPKTLVSLGQGMTEVLFSLGLADRIKGTAVWVGPVLPQFAQANRRIPRLADNDPSFEAVVAREPELVAAEFEWHVGTQGSVGTREQFAGLGINTYIAPTDCVAKSNDNGGDGVRKTLFSMDLVYREITDLAEIFDVRDRGEQLVGELKQREAAAIASVSGIRGKNLPVLFWYSSKDVSGDAFIAGKNGAPAYMLQAIGARNLVDTAEEWPLVGWETIAAANPAVIVVAAMERRRYAADDPKRKIEFLTHDPITSRLDAVRAGHIVIMDAQSMNPTIRTVDGIEALAKGIQSFGLTQ